MSLFISLYKKLPPTSLSYTGLLCSQRGLLAALMSASLLLVMPTAQAAGCKVPKSYYKNVACTATKGYFLATKDFGAPVALLDRQGKRVVDLLRYQQVDANKIAGGLIPVQRNSKVGYLDMKGREVVPVIYDRMNDSSGWARAAVEGRIVVKRGGSYGVITTANKTVVPFSSSITAIDDYKAGKARVSKGKSVSWLDKNGNTIADPNTASKATNIANNVTDNSGTSSSKPDDQRLPNPAFTTLRADERDGKWGFVDDRNVTMITYAFDDVRPFSEGLAGVLIDGKWGFVTLGGELVIPFDFDNASVASSDSYQGASSFVFKQGKAWVGNLDSGAKMCIDTQGNSISCD